MSFCCLPRRTTSELGADLCWEKRFVEDAYLLCQFALIGRPVVYSPRELVAYRLTPGSLSSNKLPIYGHSVEVFQVLDDRFRQAQNSHLRQAFLRAFASTRRTYGKLLMGSGERSAARAQFRRALRSRATPFSADPSRCWLRHTCPALYSQRGHPAVVDSGNGCRSWLVEQIQG